MYLLKCKSGLYYCGITFDLSLKQKDAERYNTFDEAKSEFYCMRNKWFLCEWTIVNIPNVVPWSDDNLRICGELVRNMRKSFI